MILREGRNRFEKRFLPSRALPSSLNFHNKFRKNKRLLREIAAVYVASSLSIFVLEG